MARETLLHNAGEDTIHDNIIRAETPADKRKNWWYYHKGHLIAALLLCAVVVSLLHSILGKTKPDYTVALMTSYTMPENGRQELERVLEQYADDRNGDGQVAVDVICYVFSTTMPSTSDAFQQQQAAIARFAADIISNESMIYIHNAEAFEYVKADLSGFFQYADGSVMPSDAVDYENAMLPWDEFQAISGFVPVTSETDAFGSEALQQLYHELRFSFRQAEGTSIEKNEKDMAYYQDSLVFYQRLLTGEKPVSGE